MAAIRIPSEAPTWLRDFVRSIEHRRREIFDYPPRLPTFTVASLPAAGEWAQGMIYVSDETGGATVAFSDGTNWRRVQDRAIVA